MKPCPFCGETPDANCRQSFTPEVQPKWAFVECSCGARGPEIRTGYKSWQVWKVDAIAAWDDRKEVGGEALTSRQ